MTDLNELAVALQALLTTKADDIARRCGFVRRRRKITGSNFAQAVVFTAMADPDATESRLHQTATLVGLNASRQAIARRFDAAGVTFLGQLLAAAVTEAVATPVAIPLLQRFTSVVALDSSVVALPDDLAGVFRGGRSGTTTGPKAAIKLTVGLELKCGTLLGPELSDGRAADLSAALAGADPPPGGLVLADLNYFSLEKFARWHSGGGDWLSRLKSGTVVADTYGRRIDLVARLRAAGAADVDLDVALGTQEPVACRLIARRVPPDVAEKRRQRLLHKSQRRGDRPSALSLALCDWAVLVTNLPRDLLTAEEALALARMRWQIELIFKLWKGAGGIDEWRGARPQAALCEVYGKLLAQVERHWVIVVGAWSRRDRSLTRAAVAVESLAISLAAAIRSVRRLRGVLKQARQMMEAAARMEKRRSCPNAHDMIFRLDPGP